MKKILFLLVLIYNYSFADYCPIQKINIIDYANSWKCDGYSQGTFKIGSSISPQYMCYQVVASGVPCGDKDILQQAELDKYTPDNHTCYINSNNEFKCNANVENGDWDNGTLSCHANHSLTGVTLGIPACMPNPENGTWDDNDDLVCNHNYHKNEDGSGCVLDDGWNDIPIDVDTGTSNGDGGIGGTGDTGSGSTGSTDSGSGTGGTSGGSTDSGSGTGGTSTGGTGTSGGSTDSGSGTGGTSTGGTSGGSTDSGSGTGGTSGGSTGGTGTSGGGTDGNGTDLGGVISAVNKNTSENTKALEKLNESLNSTDSTLTDDLSSKYSKNDSDFLNFYNDMKSSYDNFNSQFDTAKGIFENGFEFTPIYAVNNPNLKECLTIKVFGKHEVLFDFITPLNYIKPIFTLIIQLFMLVEVVRVCFKIVNYARGLF